MKMPPFRFQLNEHEYSALTVHHLFFFLLLSFTWSLTPNDVHFSSNYMINVQVFHTFIDITVRYCQPSKKPIRHKQSLSYLVIDIFCHRLQINQKTTQSSRKLYAFTLHRMREKLHIISTPFLFLISFYPSRPLSLTHSSNSFNL